MNCYQCGEAVDNGALFCGNCGAKVAGSDIGSPNVALAEQAASRVPLRFQTPEHIQTQLPQPTPTKVNPEPDMPATMLPAYAVANPIEHKANSKAMVGLILAVLALPGALIPVIGWGLAITGIVLASSARQAMHRKLMANVATGFAVFGILLSTASFGYNVHEQQKTKTASADTSSAAADGQSSATVQGNRLDTPCYMVNTSRLGKISQLAGSCKAQAFNAETLAISTDALTIEGVIQSSINESNLAEAGRQIADSHLKTTIPNLTITSQQIGSFAGSPAYIINGKNTYNVTIQMALVLRKVSHGENVFVIAHAINDKQASLAQFESQWEWKQ